MLQRKEGSIFDVTGDTGVSVLARAFQDRQFDIAELLLQEGADMFQPSDDGHTALNEVLHLTYGVSPLGIACRGAHLDVVRLLIQAGADVNSRSPDLRTPLFYVCAMSRTSERDKRREAEQLIEICAELLHHGADINALDFGGATPLDSASLYNRSLLMDFLLDMGADPDHRDWEGSNSLANTTVYNACDAAAVLLRRGVDYRNIDDSGMGILHYAAMGANVEMMELLAGFGLTGLDVTRQDDNGRSPLQHCISRPDSSDLLRETFERLLNSVSQAKHVANDDGESDDEFFGVGEFHDALGGYS